jgi:hypothetical protein
MGRYKWHHLATEYALEQTEAPSAEVVERTLGIYRARGLKAF